ncbi:hypothetical protein [Bradyrhizobium sp. CCBAU 51765]|jgi:hypothetical protein|uniref:hypothetical protein n=1 Tax=Bradyrhizobium sp. CCBAU 51765 TaxID=1325102 RepID=UPI0018870D0F|nr:hypothetical protein [Bradyrhizobium sp. CCBAU 51765]QOZ09637.1 hypothetical protein XH96_20425 [Bradyrhizobium sp. CCBAU 51765]
MTLRSEALANGDVLLHTAKGEKRVRNAIEFERLDPDRKLHSGQRMFFFFSNRLGCLGSLLISGLITVALLFLFGILRF